MQHPEHLAPIGQGERVAIAQYFKNLNHALAPSAIVVGAIALHNLQIFIQGSLMLTLRYQNSGEFFARLAVVGIGLNSSL